MNSSLRSLTCLVVTLVLLCLHSATLFAQTDAQHPAQVDEFRSKILRVGAGGVTSIPGAVTTWGAVPLGPDLAIWSNGPADVVLWAKPYILTSSTPISGPGVATISVPGGSNLFTNDPDASHSPTAILVNRFHPDAEGLLAGTSAECSGFHPPSGKFCLRGGNQVTANFTKAHSSPFTLDQSGANWFRTYVLGQTAQDGASLWFCSQTGGTAPYPFACMLGNGAYAYMAYSGGTLNFRANNYLADGKKSFGLMFNDNQAVLRTGPNSATFIQDSASAQQAKFTNTQTDLPAKVTLGGTTSSSCMWKVSQGPVLGARKADDSADCNLSASKATFSGGLQIGSAGTSVNSLLTGSATLRYPAIPAQSCSDEHVSVQGAGAGKPAFFSPAASGIGPNLTWSSWVSAENTVTVRVCNPTGGALTPSSVAWTGWILQ